MHLYEDTIRIIISPKIPDVLVTTSSARQLRCNFVKIMQKTV